jgi:hypothetical protein
MAPSTSPASTRSSTSSVQRGPSMGLTAVSRSEREH